MISNPNQVVRFDWAMKHLLRDKANFDILEGFLCALLPEDVEILEILESESDQELAHLKYNRVDILVKNTLGEHIIIEVQNQHEAYYLQRLLFGTSKLIVEQLDLGQDYGNVAKVISISILYFNMGRGDDYVYHGKTEFRGLHNDTPLKLRKRTETDGEIRYPNVNEGREIFPEYYLIQVERFEDEIKSPLDEWIYMLKNDTVREDFRSKNIDKARRKLNVMNMEEERRRRYEKYLMLLMSERTVLADAEKKGLKQGLEQGLEQGERKKQLEIAHNMLKAGMSHEQISAITGLSHEEVDNVT